MVHQEIIIYLNLNKGHSFPYVHYNRFHWLRLKWKLQWITCPELIFILFRSLFHALSLTHTPSVSCLVGFQLWWFQMALCRFWQISRCCVCVRAHSTVYVNYDSKCESDMISDAKMKTNQDLLSFCRFLFNLVAMFFCDLARCLYLDECRWFWLWLWNNENRNLFHIQCEQWAMSMGHGWPSCIKIKHNFISSP